MRSANLDMHSGVLGCEHLPTLLYVTCSVEKHAIDTSTQRIQLLDPRIEQPCNVSGIFLSTIYKLVRTYTKRTTKEQWLVQHKKKNKQQKQELTVNNR